MNQFADPAAPSAGIQWGELNGALLLIEVTGVEQGIQTQFGAADAVRADVTVLDGPKQGEEHDDTLIFPKLLASQLRPRVNQKVLGRLGQGAGKPGQSPPWMLNQATPQDQQLASQYLAAQMAQPGQQQPQANPQPQGQGPQQPQQTAAQQWPQQQGQQQGGQGQPASVPF